MGGLEFTYEEDTYCPWDRFLPVAATAARYLPQGGKVADIGCGVGSLGLWLGFHRPDARIFGFDISETAVRLSISNAQRLGVKAHYAVADGLGACKGPIDLALANLPYEAGEGDDPRYVAGIGGYEVVCRAFLQARYCLSPKGHIVAYSDTAHAVGWMKMWRLLRFEPVEYRQTDESGSTVWVVKDAAS